MARKRKSKSLFQFDLLPPKSQQQIAIERERDDSLVYSIVLVFFAILIYFVVTIVQASVVVPRLEAVEQAKLEREQEIASFTDVRSRNGELFIKTSTLDSVLEKDLAAQEIFRVADAIAGIDSNVGVISYAREQSGVFVFDFITNSLESVPLIVEEAKVVEGVSNVYLRNVEIQTNGRIRLAVELVIANV